MVVICSAQISSSATPFVFICVDCESRCTPSRIVMMMMMIIGEGTCDASEPIHVMMMVVVWSCSIQCGGAFRSKREPYAKNM